MDESGLTLMRQAPLMLTFPGSFYGWFSIPSKVMNKGNGENLAALYMLAARADNPLAIGTARLPDAVLLRSTIHG